MSLDPNIILSGVAPKIDSPIDSATKAATLNNLTSEAQLKGMQVQQGQLQLQNQTAMKQAMQNNMAQGLNGQPTLNQAGYLSDLAKQSPNLAMQEKARLSQQNLAQDSAENKQKMDLLQGATPENWQDVVAEARRRGLTGSDKLPDQHPGDSAVQGMISSVTDHGKLIEQQQKQQQIDIEKQKADIDSKKLGLEIAHYGTDKDMKATEDFNQAVASGRQSPDAQQSLKDIQSAKKLNELLSAAPKGDLNKLNDKQTKLAMFEVVKAAGGGVPAEGEMETMTPDTVRQKYGSLVQKWTGKSTPANAGEFLQQGRDYMNGISAIGQNTLTQRSNEIADRMKDYWTPGHYQQVKDQIATEFNDKPSKVAGQFAPHPQDSAAVAKANSILKDPNSTPADQELAHRVLSINSNSVANK